MIAGLDRCSCWLVGVRVSDITDWYCDRCGKPVVFVTSESRKPEEVKPRRKLHGPMTHDRRRDWWNRYE